MTATRPVHPQQPLELVELITCHNVDMNALNAAIRGGGYGIVADLTESVRQWKELIRDWYATPAGQAYKAAVAVYNAQVDAWNAQGKADRQARANAREVAAVRSAACPRCYATHAGECA